MEASKASRVEIAAKQASCWNMEGKEKSEKTHALLGRDERVPFYQAKLQITSKRSGGLLASAT